MKMRPAAAVTPPAAMANRRTSRRSDPATASISPAATSSAPIMSDEICLPAGSRSAPALSRMIAMPATRSASARLRSDSGSRASIAKSRPFFSVRTRKDRLLFPSVSDHLERSLADPVVERRLGANHLPVERDGELGPRRRNAEALDTIEADHVVGAAAPEEGADACSNEAAAGLLAHEEHAQLAPIDRLALAGGGDVDPVIVVADEQQRRVDVARPLLVDGQSQSVAIEADERAQRGDDHRQPLATPEPPALQVAVDDHQRIKADRAVVDEDPAVHLADVDAPAVATGDQLGRLVEIGGQAEVAREMVERAERKDSEQG